MKNLLKNCFACIFCTFLFVRCDQTELIHYKEDLTPQTTNLYRSIDFHQHTTYTDGSWSIGYVMAKNKEFNLDSWANSEHGGGFSRDGAKSGFDFSAAGATTPYQVLWTDYVPNPILGKANGSNMWRWQEIRDYSYKEILKARATYSDRVIFQGYEWNVPGHEHASTCILTNQFGTNGNVNAIAEFEYKFDGNDLDDKGSAGWVKSTNTAHAKTLEAITWLQTNHKTASWVVPAHPERKSLYNIAAFRDMNNAGPDVCFGFESMPGHQKSAFRGEYKPGGSTPTVGNCTYGGTGIYAAKVGGLWDALLSEGRKWWLFANSDFHHTADDFFPGEYQKTYVSVTDKTSPQAYVDGLRSGNAFIVTGDLIDALQFHIDGKEMGQTVTLSTDNAVTLTILVHDPSTTNNNKYGSYNSPVLNHIDVISGKVGSLIAPTDAAYSVDDVTATTNVIARFDATGGVKDSKGLESRKWEDLGDGWKRIQFNVSGFTNSAYFRLRGTNLGLNVANQTDAAGNPLADSLLEPNDATKAFDDLWFYSNPIFVKK